MTEDEAVEKFRSLLGQSVARRLRSDVSVGTSLSGGLDSSSIVAFCDETTSSQYSHKCFTASFPGFEKDESAQSSQVASHLGLQQFIVPVTVQGLLKD